MKVIHIGKYYHPYDGGTEMHLSILADALKKDTDIKILAANTKFKTQIENIGGVIVYRLERLFTLFSVPITIELPFRLKSKPADILHFHLPNPVSIFSYLISRPKGRVIVSYYSDIIRQKFSARLFAPLLQWFLGKAERVMVTSDILIANSPVLIRFRSKYRIILHGIDISRFEDNKETAERGAENQAGI